MLATTALTAGYAQLSPAGAAVAAVIDDATDALGDPFTTLQVAWSADDSRFGEQLDIHASSNLKRIVSCTWDRPLARHAAARPAIIHAWIDKNAF